LRCGCAVQPLVPWRAGAAWAGDACALVAALCGRESIFLFSHTNEFCGKSKVAPEPRVAWSGLKWGRRVCERGQPRKQVKRLERVPPAGRCHCGGAQRTNLETTYLILKRPSAGLLRRLVGFGHRRRRVTIGNRPPRSRQPLRCTAYWGCPKAAGGSSSLRRRMGSVGGWPMARPTN
jgi:hypothetical protein